MDLEERFRDAFGELEPDEVEKLKHSYRVGEQQRRLALAGIMGSAEADMQAAVAEPDLAWGERPMIYKKLAQVMADLPAVGKDSVNTQQGWNFRGVDAVVNAISPALRKHGVVVIPELVESGYRDTQTAGRDPRPTREVTVKVKYTFFAEDGSSVSAIVPGESLDQSDKGSAKAMSVAFRIALLQVFALPTSEPDPDASYHVRDGGTSMTPTVAKVALALILDGNERHDYGTAWNMVTEHAAQDRAVPADLISDPSGLTWSQVMGDALSKRISRIETWDEGREFKALVEELGFQRLNTNLKARADYLANRRREAFDASMQAVTTATTLEGLEAATVAAGKLLDQQVLSEAQATELHKVAHERGEKLARELNRPQEADPEPVPVVREEETIMTRGDA